MLQQTQVATVIGYFQRFVAEFPDLPTLAAAPVDRVMRRWEGLGYYSRARNLHRAAQVCVERHGGELPRGFDALLALPGIGRSTAGAILAQSFDEPWPILDGNAKRVLARRFGVDGWPGRSAVARQLWTLSEQCLPDHDAADYTQAIMDLGATLCTPRQPACDRCPLETDCIARLTGKPEAFPGRKPRRERPRRHAWLLLDVNEAGVLLEKRPPSGIWGGLWCPPLNEAEAPPAGCQGTPIEHAFTHFRLTLTPVRLEGDANRAVDDAPVKRCDARAAASLGVPRPVRVFLDLLFSGEVVWRLPEAGS